MKPTYCLSVMIYISRCKNKILGIRGWVLDIFGGGQKEILKVSLVKYIHMSIMTTTATTTNAKKVVQLKKALAEMLSATLRRGFFGTAVVEVSVQDGTIQHIRRKVEQIVK
jgi:hypothetical protein